MKIVFITAAAAVMITSCTDKEYTSYTFTGTVEGLKDGTKVLLKPVEEGIPMTIFTPGNTADSTVVKDGKFTFTGKQVQAKLFLLVINSKSKSDDPNMPNYQPSYPIFLENGDIELTAKLDSIPLANYLIDEGTVSLKNIQVKGSKSQDIYISYLNGLEPYAKKDAAIFNTEYLPYLNPEKGSEKQSTAKGVDIVTRLEANAEKENAYVFDFIVKNLSNSAGLTIAQNTASKFNLSELNQITSKFTAEQKQTDLGKKTLQIINELKSVAPGAQYVDLPFEDDKGNAVKLSDFVGKGKFVLLEFWASWCHPCRADIPHLKEVYALYHPKGFDIVGVSMDDNKEKWLQAVKEEQFSWPQISDLKAFTGDLTKIYKFRAIPTCLLIDPTGKIVTNKMRGSFMDKRLIEMYGNEFEKQK